VEKKRLRERTFASNKYLAIFFFFFFFLFFAFFSFFFFFFRLFSFSLIKDMTLNSDWFGTRYRYYPSNKVETDERTQLKKFLKPEAQPEKRVRQIGKGTFIFTAHKAETFKYGGGKKNDHGGGDGGKMGKKAQ
jgi:hypothetical protein